MLTYVRILIIIGTNKGITYCETIIMCELRKSTKNNICLYIK